MNEKVTLLIHPFFFVKHHFDMRSNRGQTNCRAESIEKVALESLETYVSGIDFAKDGILIIYRSPPYNWNFIREQQLFEYAQSKLSSNLYFYLPLDEMREDDSKEDGLKVTNFLLDRLGNTSSLENIQLYGFGEDLAGCVAWNLRRVSMLYKTNKKPVILTRFCRAHPEFSFEERMRELKLYNKNALKIE